MGKCKDQGSLLGRLMSRGMFAAALGGVCSLFFKRTTKGTADSRRAFKEDIVSSILRTRGRGGGGGRGWRGREYVCM